MAMTGAGLAAARKAAKDAVPAPTANTAAAALVYATAMNTADSTAIVSYLTANMVVAVTVTSVTGVTPGAGVSGPGTGTGTVS
jgi:ABC-type branched-subunit amino acid transport system substrate-binding protein